MAKRVNSFSDLFQAGPSGSQLFEGLDEIIPPSMLNSADASMPTQPQPQPQPLPQAPILVADPPVEPEAAPVYRRLPRTKYTKAQREALAAFFAVYSDRCIIVQLFISISLHFCC